MLTLNGIEAQAVITMAQPDMEENMSSGTGLL
jgi:hypothetical protein